jgi:hypothetical protein
VFVLLNVGTMRDGLRECCIPLGTPNSICIRNDAGWNGGELGYSFFFSLACLTRLTVVDETARLARSRCGGSYLEAAWCSSHDTDFPFTTARGTESACISPLHPALAQTLHSIVTLFLHK